MDLKAFVFDMDGILLDTERICWGTWQQVGKELGLDPEKMEEANFRCMGTNKRDSALILKEIFGNDFDGAGALQRSSDLFHQIEETAGIPLMHGVVECLEYLKSKNYRLALASSTRKTSVERQLTRAGIIHFFETITTGDMVTHSKPEPDIYRLSVNSLGLKPSDCVCVEDSFNGIRSGKAAGLKTIMVPDRVQPDEEILKLVDWCFKSLDEIKKYF